MSMCIKGYIYIIVFTEEIFLIKYSYLKNLNNLLTFYNSLEFPRFFLSDFFHIYTKIFILSLIYKLFVKFALLLIVMKYFETKRNFNAGKHSVLNFKMK